MKTGMLWFDDDEKRPLHEKVERAVMRFREKYGRYPNICYANPHTLDPEQTFTFRGIGNVVGKQARSVLPNHFWLGVSESES